MADLKTVYRAATREEAEANLLTLGETWGDKYAIAVRSWEQNAAFHAEGESIDLL